MTDKYTLEIPTYKQKVILRGALLSDVYKTRNAVSLIVIKEQAKVIGKLEENAVVYRDIIDDKDSIIDLKNKEIDILTLDNKQLKKINNKLKIKFGLVIGIAIIGPFIKPTYDYIIRK